jgi:hypothetical protein
MQNDAESHDPFNWTYLLVALVVLLALPLMHVFLAWTIYYF